MIALLLMTLASFAIDCTAAGVADVSCVDRGSSVSLGYDAAESSQRRRTPNVRMLSEDDHLPQSKRSRLQSNAQDIQRNFAIAAWAIRKHLDFVTAFQFASNNSDSVLLGDSPDVDPTPEQIADEREKSMLDEDVEKIVAEASTAERFDSAGRHDLPAYLRLQEARATVDGDAFSVDVADGSTAMVESDRVRDPSDKGNGDWVLGIRIDNRGRASQVAIHRRAKGSYAFDRVVPWQHVYQRAYFDRYDQVRGVSPMAPSLNTLRDVYEGFDYALARLKIEQLFGLKVTRAADAALGNITDEGTEGRPDYTVDMGKGIFMLDMEQGDDAQFLESKAPGANFISYSEMMVAISLLALDLPWNFFKVDATNFFGSRAALNLYLKSARHKRAANHHFLRRWTRRQLQMAILQGRLVLPRSMTVDDLRFSWTPDGMPWWNPSQEADGALKSINAGLDNPQRIALETGTSFFDNVDRIAECLRYAQRRGVPLSFSVPTQIAVNADGGGA